MNATSHLCGLVLSVGQSVFHSSSVFFYLQVVGLLLPNQTLLSTVFWQVCLYLQNVYSPVVYDYARIHYTFIT